MILNIAAAAVLFTFAFPNIFFPQGLPFLSWIFAIPFFFALEDRNLAGRLQAGFLFGLLSNLAVFYWMIPYSLPGYLLIVLALTSQNVIFAAFYRPLWRKTFFNVFYVGATWVASEYLRKFLMLGESWNIAHAQTFDIAFMQGAQVLGSFALSFVLIAVNYALYCALQKSQDWAGKINGMVAAVLVVGLTYGYGFMTLNDSTLPADNSVKVCVLQTNHDYHGDLPDEQVNTILEKNILLTREAVATQPKADVIIWPETAIPTDFLQDPAMKAKVIALVKEIGTNFLIGAAIHDEKGDQHNSAVLLDANGDVKKIYDKRYLIPLTEFIPDAWLWRTIAKSFGVKTPDLVAGTADTAGLMEIALPQGNVARFGVAICSEDNIDDVFREYRRQGAHFVVVLLNDGWFSGKAGAVMHAQHSIVRAVENRLPVIRSANSGWSGMIDPFGGTPEESFKTLGERGFSYYEIPVQDEKNRTNNLGDTFCVLCVAFVILMKLYKR